METKQNIYVDGEDYVVKDSRFSPDDEYRMVWIPQLLVILWLGNEYIERRNSLELWGPSLFELLEYKISYIISTLLRCEGECYVDGLLVPCENWKHYSALFQIFHGESVGWQSGQSFILRRFRLELNWISFAYSIVEDHFKNLVPALRTVRWDLLLPRSNRIQVQRQDRVYRHSCFHYI